MGINRRRDDLRAYMHRAASRPSRACRCACDGRRIQLAFGSGANGLVLADYRCGAGHDWLVIACDSCQNILEMDLTMKPRDPEAPIRVALDDVRCLRFNGHGPRRILGLARFPSR
jgi:hypothetical protein